MREYNVAILGSTGAVGNRMIDQLAQSSIPVKSIKLLASKRSAGKTLIFRDQAVVIEEATPDSFNGVDLVFASAGGSISRQLLPEAVKRGAVCVDNSSAFRMDPTVPLVVPEVNSNDLATHQGIIANPNCSTIQMVVALNPIYRQYGLKRVIVSTYQAAGGAGQSALDELNNQSQAILNGETPVANILPVKSAAKHYPLAFNLIPQIDVFDDQDYTYEEWKMTHETKKILLGDPETSALAVSATCVRVPVPIGHGESVYFETQDTNVTPAELKALLASAPGVVLQDNPAQQIYPMPINAVGQQETYVGRIRADLDQPGGFHAWVVADNLLKGAAWNAIQIGECLVEQDLVHAAIN